MTGAHRRPRWRTLAAWAVTVVVLLVVFVGVLPKFAHYSEAWSSIRRMPVGYVLGLAVAAAANIGVGAWQVQAALPGLSYRRAFVVDSTSFAVSNAVPAGGPVAFGVAYDMLASYGFSAGAAAGATAIALVFNFLGTLAMPVVGVVALLATGQVRWHYLLIAIVGSLLVGGCVAGLAAVLRSEASARRVGRVADRYANAVTRRLLHGRTFDIAGKVLDFRANVVGVLRKRWPAVLGATLLTQLTSWAILFLAIRGLEHGARGEAAIAWPESLAAFSFAMILWSAPVTAGGLGTVDATLTGLLSAFGAHRGDALAADLVWRAATFVPQVLTGVLTFLWWRATAARRRR
jgi:uncharacterized membrane protein YbhN (UPF0104 family)